MTMQWRREQVTEEITARTGIGDAMIERLVRAFYARAMRDLLGPVSASRVSDREAHLHRIFALCSSVVLMTGKYHGQPMRVHLPLPVDALHFDRWLALFEETAREICPAAAADHFTERAKRIAQSLEAGMAVHHGAKSGTAPVSGVRSWQKPRGRAYETTKGR